jgi:hypothetical protein
MTNRERVALLAPHAAGFGSLLAQRAMLPTNAVWRVRVSVAEELFGIESAVSAVVNEPRLIAARIQTGNTNFAVNPFRRGVSRFGHWSEAVSEAVTAP